ncbi:MAG TPA: GNAT family N-acetyltransferase [Alphaproteobacteria bacterium]|nr:GNAT family N-acetyltransferase [Alphaproteobacteria bacterium]
MTDHFRLETRRLILRHWREEDRAPFAALNADPRVMAHFPKVLDRSESDEIFTRVLNGFQRHGYGPWALEVRGGEPFIGFCGIWSPRFTAHFTPCIEIGWRLAFDAWGRGYATEAAQAALAYGFDSMRLEEIVAYAVPENVRSRQVMERLGMVHDPADDFDHPLEPEAAPIRRHVLYRLGRDAWRARHSAPLQETAAAP